MTVAQNERPKYTHPQCRQLDKAIVTIVDLLNSVFNYKTFVWFKKSTLLRRQVLNAAYKPTRAGQRKALSDAADFFRHHIWPCAQIPIFNEKTMDRVRAVMRVNELLP